MRTPSRSHKITKQPVDPERVRTMPAQFGAVDRRLVYQKHIRRMSAEQIALYLFLQCVSDAEGLSFYSEERICEELHFSLNGLWKARDGLEILTNRETYDNTLKPEAQTAHKD